MQDFIKLVAVIIDESQNPKKQPNWVTKDRFWTFVFWFGMSLGLSVSLTISENGRSAKTFSYWSSFFFWVTLIGMPLVLKKFNGTKFIKALTFANSEGTVLTEERLCSEGVRKRCQ